MNRPHPTEPSFGRHFTLHGALAPGTVVGDGVTVREVIPIHGWLRARIRGILAANDGTLSFKYVIPTTGEDGKDVFPDDGSSVSVDGPSNLSLSTTEAKRDIDELFGEAFLEISYTDAGGGSTIGKITVSGL